MSFTDGITSFKGGESAYSKASKNEQIVDIPQILQAHQLYLTNSSVGICVEELNTLLFSHGLDLTVDGKLVTDEDMDLLKTEMLIFLRDAFMAVMILGVIPVEFVSGPKKQNGKTIGFGKNNQIPRVPTFGTYYLTTFVDSDKQQAFKVYTGGNLFTGNVTGKEDASMKIVAKLGYSPLLDGSLASPMHRVASRLVFTSQLYLNAMLAHRTNALAPILLRHDPSTAPDVDPKLKSRYFATDMSSASSGTKVQAVRNPEQQREFARQMNTWAARTNQSTESLFGVRTDGVEDVHNTDVADSFFKSAGLLMPYAEVPPGFAVAPYPRSTPPPDIIKHERHILDIVISILLTPKLLFTGTSQTARSDSAKVEMSMFRTARKWATLLESTLNSLHDMLVFESFRAYLKDNEVSLDTLDVTPSQFDELRAAFEDKNPTSVMTFSLRVPLQTTGEDLKMLHEEGIITREEYVATMRGMHHFSGDKPVEPKPEKRKKRRTPPPSSEEESSEEDVRRRPRRKRRQRRGSR